MNTRIPIEPARFVTGVAVEAAASWISYDPQSGSATADMHLFAEDGNEVGSKVVSASAEEAADWSDDVAFLKVLAAKIEGVVPVEA